MKKIETIFENTWEFLDEDTTTKYRVQLTTSAWNVYTANGDAWVHSFTTAKSRKVRTAKEALNHFINQGNDHIYENQRM
jgi:hypothetical protein